MCSQDKIQDFFHNSNNTRNRWKGIQVISNYKTNPPASDVGFLNHLNDFFGRFKALNGTSVEKDVLH